MKRSTTEVIGFLIVLVACSHYVGAYECGVQSGGAKCVGKYAGFCCSQYGNCGTSEKHCGAKCQEGFGLCEKAAADSECGSKFYGKNCTGIHAGTCCSKYGNCGKTEAYCGAGCQAESGPCGSPVPDNLCGPMNYGKKCTGKYAEQCCGPDGTCGKSKEFCGVGCKEEFGGPCKYVEEIIERENIEDKDDNCGNECCGCRCGCCSSDNGGISKRSNSNTCSNN